MQPPTPHIFRAYDIRGLVPQELNQQLCYAIGQALASMAAERGLNHWVLGYDGRLSSPQLAQALAEGLVAGGMDVHSIGLGPTPLLYFAACNHPQQCGVMVTGSHNPPEYNGMKIMLGGQPLAQEGIQEVLRRIVSDKRADPDPGTLTHGNCVQQYITNAIASSAPITRSLRVVIDAGNGAAGDLAPQLLRAYGCQVHELYCEIDGTFPNHHPDPGDLRNLEELRQQVVELGADLGLAFDGDGDRLGVVSNTGTVIFPDRVLMAYAEDLLQRHPQARVLMDVKCSPLVQQFVASKGGEVILSPTGHSLIKRAMKEHGALLAGEMSGHMFFAEQWNGCDDALLAAIRLVAQVSRFAGDSDAFFARYPAWVGTAEINLSTSEQQKWEIVQRLTEHGDFGDGTKVTIDGIRVEYEDSWGLVRCSNTSAKLVLRFEGKNEHVLTETIKKFSDQLAITAPEIDLSPLLAAFCDVPVTHHA